MWCWAGRFYSQRPWAKRGLGWEVSEALSNLASLVTGSRSFVPGLGGRYSSLILCGCDKTPKTNAWGKKKSLFDLDSTTQLREVQTGPWKQDLKQRLWKKVAYWLDPYFCSASFLIQPKGGTAHYRLGPPPSGSN